MEAVEVRESRCYLHHIHCNTRGTSPMSGNSTESNDTGVLHAVRDRQTSTSHRSQDSSPSDSTMKENHATVSNTQFLPIRSRVGKRFQATLPEIRKKPQRDELNSLTPMNVMHVAKPRYSLDKATGR